MFKFKKLFILGVVVTLTRAIYAQPTPPREATAAEASAGTAGPGMYLSPRRSTTGAETNAFVLRTDGGSTNQFLTNATIVNPAFIVQSNAAVNNNVFVAAANGNDNVMTWCNYASNHYSASRFVDRFGDEKGAVGWGNTNALAYPGQNYIEDYGLLSGFYFTANGLDMGGEEAVTGDFVWLGANGATRAFRLHVASTLSQSILTFAGNGFITNNFGVDGILRVGTGATEGGGFPVNNADGSPYLPAAGTTTTSATQLMTASNYQSLVKTTVTGATTSGSLGFYTPAGVFLTSDQFNDCYIGANVTAYARWADTAGLWEWICDIAPKTDNTQQLGTTGKRWASENVITLATTRSNLLAPTAITLTGSAFNWTNTTVGSIFVIVDGGTAFSVAINGTTVMSGLAGGLTVPLQPSEYVTITYTVAPSAFWKPY